MPRLKQFNISSYVDEASTNVKPQKNYDLESGNSPLNEKTEKEQENKAEEIKPQRGRKKSLRTIPRQNGKVVFLEVEADAAIARISVLQRVDKQDIIRTALDEFLKKHYDGSDLDTEGSQLLTQYIQKTTQIE